MSIASNSNDDLLAKCLAGINLECLDAEEAIQKYKDEINHDQSQIDWYQSHIDAKTRVAEHTKGGGIAHTAHGATIFDTVYKYSATQRQEWQGKEDAAKQDLSDAKTALQSLQDRLNSNSIQLTTMMCGAYSKLQLLDPNDKSTESYRADLETVQTYTESLVSFLIQQIVSKIVAQDGQKEAAAKSTAAGDVSSAANKSIPAADPSAARAETAPLRAPVSSEGLSKLPVFVPAAPVRTDAAAPQTLAHSLDPAFLYPILDAVEKDIVKIVGRPDADANQKMAALLPFMSGVARLSSALLEAVPAVQGQSVQPVNKPAVCMVESPAVADVGFNQGESLRPIVDRLAGLIVLTHPILLLETVAAPEATASVGLDTQTINASQPVFMPALANEIGVLLALAAAVPAPSEPTLANQIGVLLALAAAVPAPSEPTDAFVAVSKPAALPKPIGFADTTPRIEGQNQTTGKNQTAEQPVRLENPVQSPAPANVIVEERPASQAEPISTAGVLVSETNPFTAQTQNPIGDLAAPIQPVSPSIDSLRLLESAIQSLAASPYYIAPILESGVAEQAALEGVVKTFGQGGVPGSIGLSAAEIANAGVEHSAVRTILLPPVALAGSAPELFQEFQGEATGSEGSDEEGESVEGLSSGVSVQDLDVNDRILSV